MDVVFCQSKSPAAASQNRSPPVNSTSIDSIDRLRSHQSISLRTHGDAADSGDARRMKCAALDNARSIAAHSAGLAERLL